MRGLALLWLDRIPLPRKIASSRMVQLIWRIPATARQVFLSFHCISSTTLLSVVIHVSIGISPWLLAFGLGVRAPPVYFIVLAPLVISITAVPISIGGWGLREGAMVTAMSLIGIPVSTSLTISVEFGLVMIVVGMPGGLIWLLDKGEPISGVTLIVTEHLFRGRAGCAAARMLCLSKVLHRSDRKTIARECG
jgi:glycosyltransferase 2 family protein